MEWQLVPGRLECSVCLERRDEGVAHSRLGDGADFLQLSPASAPVRGLTSWRADAIRAAIIDGQLRVGAPLPATRVLADDLGVSRGLVVEAYQRLTQEGLVGGRPGCASTCLRPRCEVSRPGCTC